MSKSITQLVNEAHTNSKEKGFYDGDVAPNIPEKLMLIVLEVSEAMEAHRSNKFTTNSSKELVATNVRLGGNFESNFETYIKNNFEDELADAVIRIFDLAGYLEVDLEYHILEKMNYNKNRPYKHNKKY